MNFLMELLMYFFVIIGMITVIVCIFEEQIYDYITKEYIKKTNKDKNIDKHLHNS